MAKLVARTAEEYRAAIAQLQGKVDKLAESISTVSIRTLFQIGKDLLGRSVERAPIDSGNLRAGGYMKVNGQLVAYGTPIGEIYAITESIPLSDIVTITVGFRALGDDGHDYALYQHEHVEFDHPMGGEAKYLEKTVDEQSPQWLSLIRRAISEEVRGGLG